MDNSSQFDADVAVIGFGPSGLIAALTLAHDGASVIAFEREKDIYARARAVTVNDWTMRIFQSLGLAERVEAVVEPQRANRWVTYAGEEIFRVEHGPSNLGRAPKFYNIYQPSLEAELRAGAAEYPDTLTVRYGTEVVSLDQDEKGVTVRVADLADGSSATTRVRYVIAADGGSSATRKQLGIEMVGDTLDVTWIVTLDDVRDFAASGLARYKLPRLLKIVEMVPRNASGKLDKIAIRGMIG